MAVRTLLSRKTLSSLLRNDPKPIGATAITAAAAASTQSRDLHVFTLPDLAYDYGALEPVISGEIMQIHHQKHHQTYITNYNKALEQLHDAVGKADASTTVKLQNAIKFNGGG
jgi:Fe-Mn family superoxide dismutase